MLYVTQQTEIIPNDLGVRIFKGLFGCHFSFSVWPLFGNVISLAFVWTLVSKRSRNGSWYDMVLQKFINTTSIQT